MTKVLAFHHAMNDDDDVDFKPSQITSSNLTSLFDTNRPSTYDNQSLIYTAPKAPKIGESSTPSTDSSPRVLSNEKLDIITTRNVQAYKLENGKYINQGTAGLAIIGSFDWHIYQIILYKNKRDYLSKTNVSVNFTFTVLENNYASFYDNSRQNWSVLFLSSADVQGFAKEVAIAKFNSQTKPDKVIVQDLIPLGKVKAEKQDIVKLKYSCSILNNDEIIPVEKDLSVSVELAETNAFPWHEGVQDCSEQCKRIVITPYKLGAPWKYDVEPNSPLLIELEVESITRNSSAPLGQKQKKKIAETEVQDETQIDSSADEDNCTEKQSTILSSLFLTKFHKENLLSRIAKMGQALPLKGAFASETSDSEEENMSPCRDINRLKALGKAVQQFHQNMPIAVRPCSRQNDQTNATTQNRRGTSPSIYNYDMPWEQQETRNGNNQQVSSSTTAPQTSASFNESREIRQMPEAAATDSELKLSINKVSEKVDHVLTKLQNLNVGSCDKMKEHQSETSLDPASVINSIQGVISENEHLKDEINKQKLKVDEQNKKIETLLNLTQKCFEKCSLPEERRPSRSEAVCELEKRLGQCCTLQADSEIKRSFKSYERPLYTNQKRTTDREVEDLMEQLREKEKLLERMEREMIRITSENRALMCANEEQKVEIMRSKRQYVGESSTTFKEPQYASSEESFEEIKKVMNAVNKKLQAYFDSGKQYSGDEVKDKIAVTIKEVTVEYMKYKSRQKSTSKGEFQQRENGRMSTEVRKESTHPRDGSENDDRIDSTRTSNVGKNGSQSLAFVDYEGSQEFNARDRHVERSTTNAAKYSEIYDNRTSETSAHTIADANASVPGFKSIRRDSEKGTDSVRKISAGERSLSQVAKESSSYNPRQSTVLVDGGSEKVSATEVDFSRTQSKVTANFARDSASQPISRRSTSIRMISQEAVGEEKSVKDGAGLQLLKEDEETENDESKISAENLSNVVTKVSIPQSQSHESQSSTRAHGSEIDKGDKEDFGAVVSNTEAAADEKATGSAAIQSGSDLESYMTTLSQQREESSGTIVDNQVSSEAEGREGNYADSGLRMNVVGEDAQSFSKTSEGSKSQGSRIDKPIKEESSPKMSSTIEGIIEKGKIDSVEVERHATTSGRVSSVLGEQVADDQPLPGSTSPNMDRVSEVHGNEDDNTNAKSETVSGGEGIDCSPSEILAYMNSVQANSEVAEAAEVDAEVSPVSSVRSSYPVIEATSEIGKNVKGSHLNSGIREVLSNKYGAGEGLEPEKPDEIDSQDKGKSFGSQSARTARDHTGHASDADIKIQKDGKMGTIVNDGTEVYGYGAIGMNMQGAGSKEGSDEKKMAVKEDEAAKKTSGLEKESPSGDNIINKKLGPNFVYKSCDYDTYYQSWGSMKPPPLPPTDEDSETEEWL